MGRSSIVYVIGLTLIVGLVLNNTARNSMSSMDVYIAYYATAQARTIAVSGANVGTSYILNYSTSPANFGLTFFNGHDSVMYLANTPQPSLTTLRSVAWTNMTDVNGSVIRDTVDEVFSHVQFARYSWFTVSETNGYLAPDGTQGPYFGSLDWKVTGDSVYGPAHTNGSFNLDGTPYFDQEVTSGLAPNLGASAHPIFRAGGIDYPVFQSRPSITTLQANLSSAAMMGGRIFDETATTNDVSLTFLNDQVHIQIPPGGGTSDTTLPLNVLAPNGVIIVKSADVHLRGTYQGDITVAAFGGTGTAANKGNVWIDGDIVAKTDPTNNPASTDMLGIVSGRMAYITEDLTRSVSSTLTVQAVVYCQNGELTAESFWNLPPSGRVILFGGVTQITAGSLGLLDPGPPVQVLSGFSYSIKNDPRFETRQPPFFPYSDSYRLLSWWEN